MRILLLSYLLFTGISTLNAKVTITANHPDYAGQKLEFYYHDDPVTFKKIAAFSLNFNNQGKASAVVDINEIICYYSDFGIFRGTVFIEPGKDIILKMPPLREKSFADEKNPFFEPVTFWFNTEQSENINNQISAFTLQLNQYTDKYFDRLYFQQSKVIYDSLIYLLDKNFSGISSQNFKTHKDLSLRLLQADIFRLKPENYALDFSKTSSSYWQNPAFEDLFNKAFNNQLSSIVKSVNGGDIKKAINNSDLKFLENWVKSEFKISGEITQLALLKLLYDGYYSGDLSKSAIEKMVQSAYFKNAGNKLVTKTAENIYSKLVFLKMGTPAPTICLNDLNEINVCTNLNNHKFKYILFVDIEMIVCREHLKYLETINQKFQKYLEIYVVFRNIGVIEIDKFIADNPVPGKLLIDKTGEFITNYNIKTFPQCFLLDENHNVKFESTKSPLDGFEQQFGAFMQNELFELQRNQSR